MSYDLNRIVLIGRLTRNPELKTTPNGKTVSNFSIAVGGQKSADGTDTVSYFPVVTFDKSAENLSKYIGKGDQIAVDGKLVQNRWTDAEGNSRHSINIIADHIEYLTKKREA